MTFADKIRAMTDEEMAKHLFELANYACPPGKEFTAIFCGKHPDCKKCWLDHLKQIVPAEGGSEADKKTNCSDCGNRNTPVCKYCEHDAEGGGEDGK